jgi:hypothetical protein
MKYETLRRYLGDMPPVDHYPLRDYREFRWEDSEILDYLLDHPKFLNAIFDAMKQSGAIVFDPDTRTWRGYRYQKSCCQNPSSKPDSISTPPLSKPHPHYQDNGDGGICDSRQSPNPTVTAAVNFDSGKKSKAEVRDEPW